jgi:hypothetical protein
MNQVAQRLSNEQLRMKVAVPLGVHVFLLGIRGDFRA